MVVVHALEGNRQRLDGGAMFGNAPRTLWERWCPPDERNRIELACRCALIDEGDRKVLLETGVGAFFEPKLRDRFGVEPEGHVLLESLAAHGLNDSDIDVVVLSHLHFDHAGGLLSSWKEGQQASLLFPKARFVVSAEAWDRACHPHRRDRASFLPSLNALLKESGRLELMEGNSSSTLGEAYGFVKTHGHTPGMLHTTVRGASSRLFFCADLIPGLPWLRGAVTMGYDRFPELLIDEKLRVLEGMGPEDWLFYTHDPKVAASRVASADGGWVAVDERSALGEHGMSLDN